MIETEVMRVSYAADGATTLFSFPFKINSANNVKVYSYDTSANTLSEITSFTLSPNDSSYPSLGGSVTLSTAYASGYYIIIERYESILQNDNYQYGDTLDLTNIEKSLDTLVMQQQQNADKADRSLKLSIGDAINSTADLTIPKPKAGYSFAWNDTDGDSLVEVQITDAASSAAAAANSASNAASSATAAANSASNAASSATAAANSASNAASSATAAAASQTAAANSATSAQNAASIAAQDAATEVLSISRIWKSLTAYTVGDIAYSPTSASYIQLECVNAGTTGSTEPTWDTVIGSEVTDGTVIWAIRDIKENKLIGLPDNILTGRTISGTSNLIVTLASGKTLIGGKQQVRASNTITLPARSTCLLYDKNDGTSGYVSAIDPLTLVDNNTIGLWKFNQAPGTAIPNSAVGVSSIAVANNLTPTGTMTKVDGWIDYATQLDGSTGYFTAANLTGFPTGAAAFHHTLLYTHISNVYQYLITYGSATSGTQVGLYLDASGQVIVASAGTYNTYFYLQIGKTYILDIDYTGSIISIRINGMLLYTGSATIAIAATQNLRVGEAYNGTSQSTGIFHFLMMKNVSVSTDTVCATANKFILPVFYTNASSVRKNIIDDVIPANCVSLGYAHTGSSAVLSYNDSYYMYGRREKPVGGNRKVFMGWLAFSGATYLNFGLSPFGNAPRDITLHFSTDSIGSNEMDTAGAFSSGTYNYGVYPFKNGSTADNDINGILAYVQAAGAAVYRGSWQTSGYIGAYVEVLEDYKGVNGY